jgi:hypothetical protein
MTFADEHRRLAALLDAAAAELPDLIKTVAAHHRPDVWSGRRADRFGHDLEDRHRQIRVTAEELGRLAAEHRSRAELMDLMLGPTIGI